MPIRPKQTIGRFAYLLFMHTFPACTFFSIRAIVEAIQGVHAHRAPANSVTSTSTSASTLISTITPSLASARETSSQTAPTVTHTLLARIADVAPTLKPAPSLSVVTLAPSLSSFQELPPTSKLSVILGCFFAALVILLACIPVHLSFEIPDYDDLTDRLYLLSVVMQLHFFIFLMLYNLLTPWLPQWIFILICILGYPITHIIIHNQSVVLGSSASDLGSFGTTFCGFERISLTVFGKDLLGNPPKATRTNHGTRTSTSPNELQGDLEAGTHTEFDAELEALEGDQSGVSMGTSKRGDLWPALRSQS